VADLALDSDTTAGSGVIGRWLRSPRRNADFDWDRFNSDSYRARNYLELRDDDTELMRWVGTFFARHFGQSIPAGLRGLDVGSGANLYPTMAMLPFCEKVDLWEHSRSNVEWLTKQIVDFDNHWDDFWDVYRGVGGRRTRYSLRGIPASYGGVGNPRQVMHEKAEVTQKSIFELTGRWDMGTMFFVAESITQDLAEFREATFRFGRALKPGAPFAAAFMANSTGYTVDDTEFPAVAVNCAKVKDCLRQVAGKLKVRKVKSRAPLRRGYNGMILATGVANPS
jgi:hypothetical protein